MEDSKTIVNKSNKDARANVILNKKNSKYHRKWKPFKYLSFAEKKYLSDKEAHMDHLKNEIRNNPTLLKNLDNSRKLLHTVNKPDTPHNTSQYLSSNFSQGRNEKPFSIISEYSPYYEEMEEDAIVNDFSLENDNDYCVPGGSMMDVITNEMTPVDNSVCRNEEIEKYKSIIEHQQLIISILNEKLKNEEQSIINKNNDKVP